MKSITDTASILFMGETPEAPFVRSAEPEGGSPPLSRRDTASISLPSKKRYTTRGGAGNDVAIETADLILMSNRLEKLSQAITLGRRANRIVKQNITFALSFIFLLLIANFTGNINMPLGVLVHEGSTVLVILSGLRLLL